jgi:hypothetical protein
MCKGCHADNLIFARLVEEDRFFRLEFDPDWSGTMALACGKKSGTMAAQ